MCIFKQLAMQTSSASATVNLNCSCRKSNYLLSDVISVLYFCTMYVHWVKMVKNWPTVEVNRSAILNGNRAFVTVRSVRLM